MNNENHGEPETPLENPEFTPIEVGPPPLLPIFEGFVAGLQFHDGLELVAAGAIKVGDRLSLFHDSANKYDENAIRLYKGSSFVGFIPRNSTLPLHAARAAQVKLVCHVTGVFPDARTHQMLHVTVSPTAETTENPNEF